MTEILQAVEGYLQRAKRSGPEDIMAICPFHRKADGSEERTGSFAMNIYNGLWYCHSCHAAGNLYTFFRDVGIPRADIQFRYKYLLEEAERHVPKQASPQEPTQAADEPLDESILGLFDYCPEALLAEGYPMELLRSFDVGFDEKHQRITFPVRDLYGKLMAISGRTIIDARPRYKFYDWEYKDFGLKERRLEKRALLYNGHKVRIQLSFETNAAERYVVVTEGFKSTMRVAQAGIKNVVGVLGSDLADEQQWMLERFGCPLLLMYDNNKAGRRGQIKAANRLIKARPNIFVVEYSGSQPSEVLLDDIRAAIQQAIPATVWFIREAATRYS
jgi:DNA primase